MKKTGFILVCILLVLLCACSDGPESAVSPSQAPRQSAEPSAAPSVEPSAAPSAEPDVQEPINSAGEPAGQEDPSGQEDPAAEPGEEPADSTDLEAIAKSFIGEDISALYDAIGYPESSDYAPSCLGDGEDGNLYYEGFIVYTYREGDSETVHYVD